MKYYIIAGERSGDLHGSNLIKSLKFRDQKAQFRCWGGDYMQQAGAELVHHYREMAFMGILEVIKNLRTINGYMKECQQDLLEYQPDVLILIDYAGFNLRIAKFAKKHGIKVYYYISPKVWAWNQSRALKIKQNVDKMFVILPFEEEFYQRYDYAVDYVGNPLLDAIREFKPDPDFKKQLKDSNKPLIAVLPGSRKQEIRRMLEKMLSVVSAFPQYHFVVAGVDNLPASFYQLVKDHPQVSLVFGKTYELLSHAHAAIVTSGTATLETALFEVPQVVCYIANELEYQIGKRVVKVDYISLANLIAGKMIVKELIQSDVNTETLIKELELITGEGTERPRVLQDYKELKQIMGDTKTSEKLADLIIKYMHEDTKEEVEK
jgi:lipid-A-disaccharide synthase